MIYFAFDTLKYYIKDLGLGYGIFYKLDHSLRLRDNLLLNIGVVFIIVKLSLNNLNNNNIYKVEN